MIVVRILVSCRCADPRGPHHPLIDFVAGTERSVPDALGNTLVANKRAKFVVVQSVEMAVVESESKDEGLTVESKDHADKGADTTAEDSDGDETDKSDDEESDEKPPAKRRRGRPRKND